MKKYCKKDYGTVRTRSDFWGLQSSQGRCVTDDLFQSSEDRDERSNRKLQIFQPEKRKGKQGRKKVLERKDGDKELAGGLFSEQAFKSSRIKGRL